MLLIHYSAVPFFLSNHPVQFGSICIFGYQTRSLFTRQKRPSEAVRCNFMKNPMLEPFLVFCCDSWSGLTNIEHVAQANSSHQPRCCRLNTYSPNLSASDKISILRFSLMTNTSTLLYHVSVFGFYDQGEIFGRVSNMSINLDFFTLRI